MLTLPCSRLLFTESAVSYLGCFEQILLSTTVWKIITSFRPPF